MESLRKGDDSVKVVRHGEDEPPFPIAALLAEFDGFDDGIPDRLDGELVFAARQAVHGDEKCLLSGVDPVGYVVRKTFAVEIRHMRKIAPP